MAYERDRSSEADATKGALPVTVRNPLARIFAENVRPLLVRIEAQWTRCDGEPDGCSGTGFLVAREDEVEHGCAIATALHVVEQARHTPVTLRFTREGVARSDTRQVVLNPGTEQSRRAKLVRPELAEHDIAVVVLDAVDGGGQPLFMPEAVPVIQEITKMPETGTRVAWAGYPGLAQAIVGEPQLCFYEGVIAATVNIPGKPPLFLLDGHIERGVSGGPVWAQSSGKIGYVLLGVAVNYSALEGGLPGLCAATPLNNMMKHLAEDGVREKQPASSEPTNG